MHNRAISLLVSRVSASAPVTSPTTFSLALQAAASRAWSRRVSTFVSTTSGVKVKERPSSAHISTPTTTDDPERSSGNASVATPGSLSSTDGSCTDVNARTQASSSNPLASSLSTGEGCVVGDKQDCEVSWPSKSYRTTKSSGFISAEHDNQLTSAARPPSHKSRQSIRQSGREIDTTTLPRPSAPDILCNNLTQLICHTKPIPTLPALVDYHGAFRELHSTHSYNLLLSLAIYHAAYPIFRSLLLAMRTSLIPRDLQTWKLEVRYLVHTGSWERAWKEAQEYPHHIRPPQGQERSIPLPIWLELFGMPRRASTSQSKRRRRGDGEDPSPQDTQSISPQESAIWNRRLRLLLDYAPQEMTDFQGVKPYTIRAVLWCLLRLQHREEALSITEAYFRSLPPRLSARDSKACTDIINLHVAFGSQGKGLAKLNASQTILRSLLDINPALRPDSNTLFLLLASLQRAKWCATKSQSVVGAFCAEWGAAMLTVRVKRRVVTLALKGGRPDIAQRFAVSRRELELEGDGAASSLRTPADAPVSLPARRELFKEIGKERVLWSRARSRVKSAWGSTDVE